MTLWSSIRNLFHGEDMGAGKRPTVLLPLDFEAVERVYETKTGVAQGFADKTFDIIFRVPPPVSSQWQEYLWDRIIEVFGNAVDPEWKTIATRILEDGDVESRLPRAINIYVNELATLWLQWRDEQVSFAAIAYYAAKRDQIDRSPWRSLQLEINWMADFDPHWTRGVASVRFGVPPTVAYQILLEQPLREAIMASDQRAFTGLSKHEGFGTVLRRSVEAYRTNSNSLPVANTALMVAGLEGVADRNTNLVWACLADGIRTQSWDMRGEHDVQAFALILQNAAAPGRARARAGAIDKLRYWQGLDLSSLAPHAVEVIRLIARSAKEDAENFESLNLPIDARGAIAFAEALGQDAELITVKIDPKSLTDAVIERASNEGCAHKSLITAITIWEPTLVWLRLISVAASVINDRNAEGGVVICRLLGEVWRSVSSVRPQMQMILRDNPFIDRIMRLFTAGDTAGAASITSLLLLPDVPDSKLASIWNTGARYEGFAAALDSQLLTFGPEFSTDQLLKRAAATPEISIFVDALIRRRNLSTFLPDSGQ